MCPWPHFGPPFFSQGQPGSDLVGTSEIVVAYNLSPTSAEGEGWRTDREERAGEGESVPLGSQEGTHQFLGFEK